MNIGRRKCMKTEDKRGIKLFQIWCCHSSVGRESSLLSYKALWFGENKIYQLKIGRVTFISVNPTASIFIDQNVLGPVKP
jgi:hypothetical protein